MDIKREKKSQNVTKTSIQVVSVTIKYYFFNSGNKKSFTQKFLTKIYRICEHQNCYLTRASPPPKSQTKWDLAFKTTNSSHNKSNFFGLKFSIQITQNYKNTISFANKFVMNNSSKKTLKETKE